MELIINEYYSNNAKKLHKMVDKILFKLKFNMNDNEDFYSLANEIFVDVLNRYDKTKSFDGFLYSCLTNKFKTEMTRRNRIKRKTDQLTISIDTPLNNDESGNYTLADILADKNTTEDIFYDENKEGYSDAMCEYLNHLSLLQKEVLRLISIGYTANEITNELHISRKQYDDCYAAIHSYRNISLLLHIK